MDEQNFWQGLKPVGEKRPKGLLYHYTTSDGLLGIIQDKSIRATHIRYCNDLTEYQEAFERKFTDSFLDSFAGGFSNDAKTQINGILVSFKENWDTFLISLTDDESSQQTAEPVAGDRLSQWRSYGQGSRGFSLGFDMDCLTKCGSGDIVRAGGSMCIQSCIYTAEEKKAQAQSIGSTGYKMLFERHHKLVAEFVGKEGRQPENAESSKILSQCVLQGTASASASYWIDAARFKNKSFSEECEWRLVFTVNRDSLMQEQNSNPKIPIVHFRKGAFGIAPYIGFPLNFTSESNPLRRIVVGPCPHPEESKAAVELLLASNGIQGVKVDNSDIPYRDW